MTLEIDATTQHLIDLEIEAGRSSSPGEFIRRAVEHFVIARDLGDVYTNAEIEEKIARGLASLDRGEGVDGEGFLDSLKADLIARKR